MTANPQQPPPQPDHGEGSEDDELARELDMDPESYRYWKRACAALPPMTPEDIAAVGAVLRRINARLAKQERLAKQRGQRRPRR
jgi:hypothetical protein